MKMPAKPDIHIFLVDDNEICLNLYSQFLTQLGYNKQHLFNNSDDCLAGLDEVRPDVIFLDYHIDELTGTEVLKQIKKFDQDIMVVLISGQMEIEVAVNAMQNGALDYIVKSSMNQEKMDQIMNRVENIMNHQKIPAPQKSFLKRLFS